MDELLLEIDQSKSPLAAETILIEKSLYDLQFDPKTPFEHHMSDGIFRLTRQTDGRFIADAKQPVEVWFEQVSSNQDYWLMQASDTNGQTVYPVRVQQDYLVFLSYDAAQAERHQAGLNISPPPRGKFTNAYIRDRASLLTYMNRLIATEENFSEFAGFVALEVVSPAGQRAYRDWQAQAEAAYAIVESNRTEEEAAFAAEAERRAEAERQRELERTKPKDAYGGDWRSSKDDIMGDGDTEVLGYPTEYSGQGQGPVIRFSCRRGTVLFDISWPAPLEAFHIDEKGFAYVRFEMKVNTGPIRSFVGVPSESRHQLYEMNTAAKAIAAIEFGIIGIFQPRKRDVNLSWTASELGHMLNRANRIAIRGTAINGQNMTAAYGMAGYSEAWTSLRSECRS